jgi:NADPH-dependent glutamate synthase beta subunit-like oxidoreductase
MPAAQRVQSYAEVSLGLTTTAAIEETARCLRCDIRSAER